jgi:hypothetical protein
MRFAYLITAYDNAEHLLALVNRLCPPGTRDVAIIHIDAKSELRHQAGAIAAANPAVRLVARPVAVHWGHANMLKAIRLLLREAMGHDFTHAHLISGSDWPLVSRERRVAEFGNRCWIEAVPGFRRSGWRCGASIALSAARSVKAVRLVSRAAAERAVLPPAAPDAAAFRGMAQGAVVVVAAARCAKRCWGDGPGICAGVFKGVIVGDEHAVQTIVAHHYPDRIERHRHFLRWPEGRRARPG